MKKGETGKGEITHLAFPANPGDRLRTTEYAPSPQNARKYNARDWTLSRSLRRAGAVGAGYLRWGNGDDLKGGHTLSKTMERRGRRLLVLLLCAGLLFGCAGRTDGAPESGGAEGVRRIEDVPPGEIVSSTTDHVAGRVSYTLEDGSVIGENYLTAPQPINVPGTLREGEGPQVYGEVREAVNPLVKSTMLFDSMDVIYELADGQVFRYKMYDSNLGEMHAAMFGEEYAPPEPLPTGGEAPRCWNNAPASGAPLPMKVR